MPITRSSKNKSLVSLPERTIPGRLGLERKNVEVVQKQDKFKKVLKYQKSTSSQSDKRRPIRRATPKKVVKMVQKSNLKAKPKTKEENKEFSVASPKTKEEKEEPSLAKIANTANTSIKVVTASMETSKASKKMEVLKKQVKRLKSTEKKLFGSQKEEMNQSVKKVEQWLKSIPTSIESNVTLTHSGFILPNEVMKSNLKSTAKKVTRIRKYLFAVAAAAFTTLASLGQTMTFNFNPTFKLNSTFNSPGQSDASMRSCPIDELSPPSGRPYQLGERPGDQMTAAATSLTERIERIGLGVWR